MGARCICHMHVWSIGGHLLYKETCRVYLNTHPNDIQVLSLWDFLVLHVRDACLTNSEASLTSAPSSISRMISFTLPSVAAALSFSPSSYRKE